VVFHVNIEYLCDHIEYAETVARWTFDEFIKGIKTGVTYEDRVKSMKDCHKTEFPIRLIALSDGKCVGTVSIVKNDLRCRDYTPWLAALYVSKP
jgi:hypothetical protein